MLRIRTQEFNISYILDTIGYTMYGLCNLDLIRFHIMRSVWCQNSYILLAQFYEFIIFHLPLSLWPMLCYSALLMFSAQCYVCLSSQLCLYLDYWLVSDWLLANQKLRRKIISHKHIQATLWYLIISFFHYICCFRMANGNNNNYYAITNNILPVSRIIFIQISRINS